MNIQLETRPSTARVASKPLTAAPQPSNGSRPSQDDPDPLMAAFRRAGAVVDRQTAQRRSCDWFCQGLIACTTDSVE